MPKIQKWQELLKGAGLTIISLALASLLMFFYRSHLSVATTALVLVIPVIWGVVIGGFPVGILGMILGFLIYDFVFIPPYYTLTVGATQNWIALGVYGIVVLLVARLVSNLKNARSYAVESELSAKHLFELSKFLIGERELPDVAEAVVQSIHTTFQFNSVILMLQGDLTLEVAASAGAPVSENDLKRLIPQSGEPAALFSASDTRGLSLLSLALNSSGKPIGIMAMLGQAGRQPDVQLLSTFANHAALAIEQAQLRQQIKHTELLEETDRWRRALLGSVSHDLRTPLSSIKAAASDLNNGTLVLTDSQKKELLDTIVTQTDRLTRLVVNLLDMTRIEAGVLQPSVQIVEVIELIDEAKSSLGDALPSGRIRIEAPSDEVYIAADHILIAQVIANLLDNAIRYTSPADEILISISPTTTNVTISISDSGPGVPKDKVDQIFEMFQKDSSGGRAGLGLAIAKAFVNAHGGVLSVSESRTGGARFSFSLPVAQLEDIGFLDEETATNR